MFAFMNSQDYDDKIKSIVNNKHKFKKLSKDPPEILKAKHNKLISKANNTGSYKNISLV